jgi:hypothetical protein
VLEIDGARRVLPTSIVWRAGDPLLFADTALFSPSSLARMANCNGLLRQLNCELSDIAQRAKFADMPTKLIKLAAP